MKQYRWTFWRHITFLIITCIVFPSEIIALSIIKISIFASSLSLLKDVITNDSMSIGIIGGADGPTSVSVSLEFMPLSMVYPKVMLFIILLLLYFPKKARAYLHFILGAYFWSFYCSVFITLRSVY